MAIETGNLNDVVISSEGSSRGTGYRPPIKIRLVRRICGCFVVDLVLISRILQRQERFSGLRVVAPGFSEDSAGPQNP